MSKSSATIIHLVLFCTKVIGRVPDRRTISDRSTSRSFDHGVSKSQEASENDSIQLINNVIASKHAVDRVDRLIHVATYKRGPKNDLVSANSRDLGGTI